MKTSELANEIGHNKLHVGRIRRRVSPRNDGGPLEDWEINAIKKELGILTDAHRVRVQGIFGDSKYPNFVEAIDADGNKYTVQIPGGYEPEMLIGKSFWIEQREYSPNHYVYSYNPWKQDD
jgi:hypothetical protein